MATASAIAAIKILVKEIGTLSNTLSDSVPKGSKDDKIWSVMNNEECETPHETFNRRFDAIFAEDCCDSNGRLHYVRRGKFGMGLIVSYLSKINWAADFPLDLVENKLQRLITELKHLLPRMTSPTTSPASSPASRPTHPQSPHSLESSPPPSLASGPKNLIYSDREASRCIHDKPNIQYSKSRGLGRAKPQLTALARPGI